MNIRVRVKVLPLRLGGLARQQRGGAALFMLLAFMVMAVPLVLAATQVAGQLARNSQVYERRLTESYANASDVEFAISELLRPGSENVPEIQEIPKEIDWNGAFGTDAKVYKVTPDIDLLGQGLVITQAIEYATPVGEGTTFTYTLTVKNEGSSVIILEEIVNYLPPGLGYQTGSTVPGIAFATDPEISAIGDPLVDGEGSQRCGETPRQLTWHYLWDTPPPNTDPPEHASAAPHIHLLPQYKVTLSFEATWTGAFPPVNGNTYYNRVTADYRAPWDGYSVPIEVSTPYGAEFLVDSGPGEACGYDLVALVGDTTVTESDVLGEEIEVNYTINIKNVSGGNLVLEKVFDTLPPGFAYQGPSTWAAEPPTPNYEPSVEIAQRSRLTWTLEPPYPMAANDTVTLGFTATGVVQAGASYFNDVSAVFTSSSQNGRADIVLALDNHQDISNEDLPLLKQTASAIVDRFIPPAIDGNIRIGVTRFFGCSVSTVEMTSDANLLKSGVGAVSSGATLDGAVDAEVVTFQANNPDNLAEGKTIQIGGEQIHLRNIGNNLEVVRGVNGTTAVPHANGVNILIFNSQGCETAGNGGGVELKEPEGIGPLDTTFAVWKFSAGDLLVGQTIIVDGEHMKITDIVGNELSVLRGRDFTTPVSHADGARVLVFNEGPDLGIDTMQPGFDLVSGPNLIAALYGAEAQFHSGTGERPGVPKSIIMISKFDDNSLASRDAIEQANIDAEIFALGVVSFGLNPQSQELLASDLDHMFTYSNFDELLVKIDEIAGEIPVLLTATGGTSSATAVSGGTLYDIESVDGENSGLQSRVLLRKGAVEILSWQEK